MNDLKVIETYYKGYRFRSRLEARWAVFFDALGIEWEYEPEGYILADGTHYLPDFVLHNLKGRFEGDLYVEVKGKATLKDYKKIIGFTGLRYEDVCKVNNHLLVLGSIPNGTSMSEIDNNIRAIAYNGVCVETDKILYPFNFLTVDGDYFACHIGINKNGKPELFGDDGSYLYDRDDHRTFMAFVKARQARFEFERNVARGGLNV